jgi:glycine oxidase
MSKTDYILIGGGVIGMMTARELAVRGASVAIFDRKELGKESSWAAGGILSSMRPWSENPASFFLSEQGKKLYPSYIDRLKEETAIDPDLIQSGLLIINKTHAERVKEWAGKENIKISDDFKNDSSNYHLPEHSILLPEISQIRPPRLLKALHKSLRQLPVSIYEHTEIKKLATSNNEFTHIEFDGDKLSADAVIITAGAWSQSVINDMDQKIHIKPIRGQMLCIKNNGPVLDKMILDDAHYLIPRRDGHVLIGSSMEEAGFDNDTTASVREELMEWAGSIAPQFLDSELVSHWSGLRPATPDGKPIIGAASNLRNVYFNTGHFRKGILQAPASAKLLVDFLSNTPSFMDIESFAR